MASTILEDVLAMEQFAELAERPSLGQLTHLPSTAELESRLARARRARDELSPMHPAWAQRRVYDELRQAERQYQYGRVRDACAARRPEGCWCLGHGTQPRWDDKRQCNVWCPCPEGQVARDAHWARQREATEARMAEQRSKYRAESGIPTHFRKFTFDSFPADTASATAVTRVRRWWDG